MTAFRKVFLFWVLVYGIVSAGWSAPLLPQFSDGERVCFVGDSITHGGSYHSYVYLYYLTRFPDRDIRVFNDGITARLEELHAELYRANQPVSHRFVIRRVDFVR